MKKHILSTICGQPFSENDLEVVRTIIRNNPQMKRLKLSQTICREFGWVRANGHLKDMSCRVAMLKLYRKGLITLPPPQSKNHPRGKIKEVSSLSDPRLPIVKSSVSELSNVELAPVTNKEDSRLWNELIERYHYLGYTTLPGAQIRYLIWSEEGLLGAIGFSASAWKIAPRDRWIGWNSEEREKKLHLIVNNSRFLIVPWVKVRHLASKVLSLCLRRIRRDWVSRYNYEVVLVETFVEKDRYRGTCYRASNWIYLGVTKGRGKKDIHNECRLPIKDIWVYPLVKGFREQLNG